MAALGGGMLEIYEKIVEARIRFPRAFNLLAKDLVRRLLQPDRTMRLGSGKVAVPRFPASLTKHAAPYYY